MRAEGPLKAGAAEGLRGWGGGWCGEAVWPLNQSSTHKATLDPGFPGRGHQRAEGGGGG